jgi:hypothetical protein
LQFRKIFIHSSISYLFSTTFDSATDVLSVRALVAYLNAAMPLDRWEEFDEEEVRRALDPGKAGDEDAVAVVGVSWGRGRVWVVRDEDGDEDKDGDSDVNMVGLVDAVGVSKG